MIGDGWRARLQEGLLQHLAASGVGDWRPDGPAYPATFDGVALFAGEIPQTPDRIIAVTVYDVSAATDDQVTARVQFRLRGGRGDIRSMQDLGDALQDLLDERSRLVLPGGVTLSQSRLASSANLGQESSTKRWTGAENYELDADRPRN